MKQSMKPSSDRRLRRVVIAGGGTAGWMAAAALSKTMGHVIDLTLVESDMIGTVGVGEATIPPLVGFHRLLDIKETDFMKATNATFKLGINFENWRVPGESYFHSFGTTGRDHWSAGFQHFWLKGLEKGHNQPYSDYCLELVSALQDKFAHLPDDKMNYAYHLDATAYAKFLRTFSEANGATRIEGKIDKVNLNPETGHISSLTLDGGSEIEGDLFIDCTGFRALLIGQALHTGFDDWTHYLPCDSAVAVQTESVGPAVPYTRSIAHDAGWQWRIPLQHRTGNGLVFCSRYLNDQPAMDRLMDNIEGKVLTEPRVIRFTTGRRRKQWVKNCVAMGLSSGFMEPLESTSIHLIQRNIVRLLRMMPLREISEWDIEEFNGQADWDMEHIRDFLILHYYATDRRDSAFWRHCATMDVPETLTHKIRQFRETGRIFRRLDELFAENSWIQVMMGQGVTPEAYHPVAEKMSDEELNVFLTQLRDGVSKTVARLPSHDSYVRQYAGAMSS